MIFRYLVVVLYFLFVSTGYANPYKTQEEVDAVVARTATRVYAKINRHWKYPSLGQFPSTKSKFLQAVLVPIQGGQVPHFKWTAGSLSEALDEVIETETTADCFMAATIVSLHIMKALLGEKKFTALSETFKGVLNEQKANKATLLHKISLYLLSRYNDKGTPIGPTQILNIKAYRTFKPRGVAGTHNVMCVGDDQYIGFDPQLFVFGAITQKQIEDDLYRNFVTKDALREGVSDLHETSIFMDKTIFIKERTSFQEKAPKNFFDLKLINAVTD